MERADDTPITSPGRPKPRPDTNGVPEPIEFENTGEIVNAVMASGAPENLLDAFIDKAVAHLTEGNGGGMGGNGGGAAIAKTAKKQNSIFLLLMLIVGPGGAVGAHYALKGQAASNTQEVQHLNDAVNGTDRSPGLGDRVEQTEENIRLIKVRVGTIDKSVKSIETSQTAIQGGIEELKSENVKRIQDELDDAKRELRRRDRLDRDR